MNMRFLRQVVLSVPALLVGHALAAPCSTDAQEAVGLFVKAYAAQDPDAVDMLIPKSLAAYRAALQQLLDDRYSPRSATWRVDVLGADWTPARIQAASDEELLRAYFAFGAARRSAIAVSDVRVEPSELKWRDFFPWAASYRIEVDGKPVERSGLFDAQRSGACWRVSFPAQAWMRMQALADELKKSRPKDQPAVGKGPRAKLRFFAASGSPEAGTEELAGWRVPVWIDRARPLATESNLTSAAAWWSCPVGFGPEEPALHLSLDSVAAQAMSTVGEDQPFSQLAVEIDGRVTNVAYVRGKLGREFQLCGEPWTMDEAQALAARLRGD